MRQRKIDNPTQEPAALNDFPKSERWRLFIDGYRQNEGPKAFDVREPGYLGGVETAFDLMLSGLGQPLTRAMFVELHNEAIKSVNERAQQLGKSMPYAKNEFEFRGRNGIDFGLVMNTSPDPALQNLAMRV